MNEFYNYIAYVDGLPIYVGKVQDVTIDTLNETLDNALTELYYVYKG